MRGSSSDTIVHKWPILITLSCNFDTTQSTLMSIFMSWWRVFLPKSVLEISAWNQCLLRLSTVWRTKTCAISHPRLNEGNFIREYSVRPRSNGHWNDLKEMCHIGLTFEYSRMKVTSLLSLSRGCEIAQVFVRYMGYRCCYLRFTCPIRPWVESATFWLATRFRMRLPRKHFSTIRCPNLVLTTLKSASPANAFGKAG